MKGSTSDGHVGAKGLTGAEALVAQLESYGVEYVFGLCGHTNIAVLDALSRSPITFVVNRHEQAAAHAADGYARASSKPGVLLTHVGPGMVNAATGVFTAALDSVPLVVIAGDVPSYFHGRHPHQETNLHDDASQADIYRPFVKRAWDVERVEDLPRLVERAFWTATSGRPGAVLVNVPMDLFSRPLPGHVPPAPPLPETSFEPGISADAAEAVADLLVSAERPLLYVGGGVRTAAGRDALVSLAEHLDIPVAHSLMGKGLVDDAHPLVMGMTGFWGLEMVNDYARRADVVLALGTRFAETDSSSWMDEYTWRMPPTKLIQVDIDPAELGRNYPVHLGIVADVEAALGPVLTAVHAACPQGVDRPELRASIASARRALFEGTRTRGQSDQFPLRPERILVDLLDTLPSDTVLVTDVGWNKNGVAQCYKLPPEGRFITPGGASTMGFGPAAALGVQIAWPDRTVVALIGDGGMSAQLPAVPTAVEQGAPVIWVVMNNRAHGTIADLMHSNYGNSYGTVFETSDGSSYSPDFALYARACGAEGYSISSASELAPALAKAVAARRPALIDVPMVNEPVPTPGHWNINDIYQGSFTRF
ncbi:MAG: thiamine pyrophosphate-binding protein [Actinomycetota bacterium]|jgi:acetolactate synthase-1/2/3 large subunit|nr:thiamine pyrophosphate-binding protein [Actinomycetota bacterium]